MKVRLLIKDVRYSGDPTLLFLHVTEQKLERVSRVRAEGTSFELLKLVIGYADKNKI